MIGRNDVQGGGRGRGPDSDVGWGCTGGAIRRTAEDQRVAPGDRSAGADRRGVSQVRRANGGVVPRAVLKLPVVFEPSAVSPMAVLKLPEVLELSALSPMAVLSVPEPLESIALKPLAVLLKPEVLDWSASWPVAVLLSPVVLEESAK